MTLLREHSVSLSLTLPPGDVHAGMDVFYNPVMASNRNISILLVNSLPQQNLKIADPLAGSGVRSLRFLKELKKNKIKQICVNDFKDTFPQTFQQEATRNKLSFTNLLKTEKLKVSHEEASLFLLNETGFDYIDIDPFGSPNPFLAAAVARISREGILAVTATDTAALTGTYPHVTRRKYWSESLHNYLMHETGLRILIRRVQLQGTQFDKALIPILSYHQEHYFRIYFKSVKGKEKCDEILKEHQYLLSCPHCLNYKTSIYNKEVCSCGKNFSFAGPLWIGSLQDQKLLQTMVKNNPFSEEQQFLNLLNEEASLPIVGFYDLHQIARKLKTDVPRMDFVLAKVKGVRTHFSGTGIKTEASLDEIKKLF